MRLKGHIINNKYVGLVEIYKENGLIEVRGYMNNDRWEGIYEVYYDNGKI